jgi:hypothetical protein
MGERTPQHDLVNADKHSREAGMHGSVLLGSVALAAGLVAEPSSSQSADINAIKAANAE